jgi:hypothetical protein
MNHRTGRPVERAGRVGGGEMCPQLLARLKYGVADVAGIEAVHGPPQQRLADPLGAVGAYAVGLVQHTRGVARFSPVLILLLLVRVLLLRTLFWSSLKACVEDIVLVVSTVLRT